MMAGKRRVFGAAFKAKAALAAARGARTTAQLAELFADGRQRRDEQAPDRSPLPVEGHLELPYEIAEEISHDAGSVGNEGKPATTRTPAVRSEGAFEECEGQYEAGTGRIGMPVVSPRPRLPAPASVSARACRSEGMLDTTSEENDGNHSPGPDRQEIQGRGGGSRHRPSLDR
jgi:hypothetical protein